MNAITLHDYEFLKVYPGIDTHDVHIDLPIFPNMQDMKALQAEIAPTSAGQSAPAYLIRGHGLYSWGPSMAEARRVAGATEFMLSCELELRR